MNVNLINQETVNWQNDQGSKKQRTKRLFLAAVLIKFMQRGPFMSETDEWYIDLSTGMLSLRNENGEELFQISATKQYDRLCRAGKNTERLTDIENEIYNRVKVIEEKEREIEHERALRIAEKYIKKHGKVRV